jgi:hypothetical protein
VVLLLCASNLPSSVARQNPVRERQVRAADVDRVVDAGQAVDLEGGEEGAEVSGQQSEVSRRKNIFAFLCVLSWQFLPP